LLLLQPLTRQIPQHPSQSAFGDLPLSLLKKEHCHRNAALSQFFVFLNRRFEELLSIVVGQFRFWLKFCCAQEPLPETISRMWA